MGDTEWTPGRTARVNSERFPTELAAVWYASNYYYETSVRRAREYIGVVFRERDGRFGLTVRGDGGFSTSRIRIGDIPKETLPTAVWHIHPPATALGRNFWEQLVVRIVTLDDWGQEEFSSADRRLAERATAVALKEFGHPISIYLATATLIRRYRPGTKQAEKEWTKEPPGRMR